MLELVTLGRLEVRMNGHRIDCPKKGVLVLVVLATSRDKSEAKENLSRLLWSSATKARAMHSLNQELYTLRRLIGKETITINDDRVRLTGAVHLDYEAVLKAVEGGDLIWACAQMSGPFLELDSASYDDEFDEWRGRRAAYLESRVRAALEDRIISATNAGNWQELQGLADQGTRLFPEAIGFRTSRIQSLISQGLLTEAELEHTSLSSEIGAGFFSDANSPIPTFTALQASIANSPSGDSSASLVSFIVGRKAELNALTERLALALNREGQFVIVSGSAGMGKTTLCSRFCELAAHRQVKVITASAHQTERHIGYNLLAEALDGPVSAADVGALPASLGASVLQLMPDLAENIYSGGMPLLGAEAAQRRLFEAVTRLLSHIAEGAGLLLFLDDVHWADDATIAWLHYFARRIAGMRVLVLITTRPEEEPRLLLTRNITSPGTEIVQLDLGELSTAETAALVRHLRPEWSDNELVSALKDLTGGHPFLVCQALRAPSRAEALEPSRASIQHVTNQLQLATPLQSRLLEWLAVAGAPTQIRTLSITTKESAGSIAEQAEKLSGFCVFVNDESVDFRHDLMRESVYQSINPPKRKALHGELALALKRQGGEATVLAHHFAKAGLKPEAIRYALEAATHSELIHAYPEAEHFYRLALNVTDRDADRLQITRRLAELLFRSGTYARATPFLTMLAEHYVGEPSVHLDWQWKLLTAASLSEPEIYPFLDKVSSMELLAESNGHADALLAALDIHVRYAYRRLPVISRDLPRVRQRLIELAEQLPATRVGTKALSIVSQEITFSNNAHDGLRHATQAAKWAEELPDAELQIDTMRALGVCLYTTGDLRGARKVLEKTFELIEASGAVLYTGKVMAAYSCVMIELDESESSAGYLQNPELLAQAQQTNYYLDIIGNQALLAYYNREYMLCIRRSDKVIAANTFGSWIELSVRGFRGLAQIEIGAVKEAFDEADRLEAQLTAFDGWIGDLAMAFTLIARVATLRKQEHKVIALVDRAAEWYRLREHVCYSRLRLAQAELRAATSPEDARSLCESVISDARSRGLAAVESMAETVLRKVRRRNRGRL